MVSPLGSGLLGDPFLRLILPGIYIWSSKPSTYFLRSMQKCHLLYRILNLRDENHLSLLISVNDQISKTFRHTGRTTSLIYLPSVTLTCMRVFLIQIS